MKIYNMKQRFPIEYQGPDNRVFRTCRNKSKHDRFTPVQLNPHHGIFKYKRIG